MNTSDGRTRMHGPPFGWRDLSWFDTACNKALEDGVGGLSFVVGNSRGLIRQVRQRAKDITDCLVVGPETPICDDSLRSGIAALAGTALGVLHPLLELAVLTGEVGRSAAKAQGSPASDLSDRTAFHLFDDLVVAARRKAKAVIFLVDSTISDEEDWSHLFLQVTALRGRLATEPILIVAGLDGGAPDIADVDETYSDTVRRSARMAADGKAAWIYVPPLSIDVIKEAINVDDDVASLLVTVSGGDDFVAAQRWQRWTAERTVERKAGTWSLTPRAEDYVIGGVERLLHRLIGSDDARLERVRVSLTWAAAIGEDFCVSSLAGAMTSLGYESDSVENDLDSLLESEDQVGLLRPKDCEILNGSTSSPQYLWQYQFADGAVAAYFRGLSYMDGHRPRILTEILAKLCELRRSGGRLDPAIAKLGRRMGDASTAAGAERRMTGRRLAAEIRVLLGAYDSVGPHEGLVDAIECWALCELAKDSKWLDPSSVARIAQMTLETVEANPSFPSLLLLEARIVRGSTLVLAKDLDGAARVLDDARRQCLEFYQVDSSAEIRARLARIYHHEGTIAFTRHIVGGRSSTSGYLEQAIQRHIAALEHYTVLLEEARRLHHSTLHYLSQVSFTAGDLAVMHILLGDTEAGQRYGELQAEYSELTKRAMGDGT